VTAYQLKAHMIKTIRKIKKNGYAHQKSHHEIKQAIKAFENYINNTIDAIRDTTFNEATSRLPDWTTKVPKVEDEIKRAYKSTKKINNK